MHGPTIDLANADTSPGGSSVFSPPADFAGGEDEYARWLRSRFDADPGMRQYLYVFGRALAASPATLGYRPQATGPFAARLRAVSRKVLQSYATPAAVVT